MSSSRLFNGTTFTFASTAVGKLVGMSYRAGGNWIDVSYPTDLNKLFEMTSQLELEVKLKFKGGTSLTTGTKGTTAIVWKDGTTTNCPGTWQIGPVEVTGDWDAPITSTAEARPTIPDGS